MKDLAEVIQTSAGCYGDPRVRAPTLSVTNRILTEIKPEIVVISSSTIPSSSVAPSTSVYCSAVTRSSTVNLLFIRAIRHVQCGLLHCSHLNERLEFGMESVAVLSHSFFSVDGKIVPCRTANVDLGLQDVDPGLVPNGAKCGDNRVSPRVYIHITRCQVYVLFRCA